MGPYDYRYHLRLDEPTERALEQISRCTFTTKSTLMRHYVQQGVARNIEVLAGQVANVVHSTAQVEAFRPEGEHVLTSLVVSSKLISPSKSSKIEA